MRVRIFFSLLSLVLVLPSLCDAEPCPPGETWVAKVYSPGSKVAPIICNLGEPLPRFRERGVGGLSHARSFCKTAAVSLSKLPEGVSYRTMISCDAPVVPREVIAEVTVASDGIRKGSPAVIKIHEGGIADQVSIECISDTEIAALREYYSDSPCW